MKLIHLTDLHLLARGESLYGFDPAERLNRVIERINMEHGDAELCVITGDLADRGESAAYGLLRELLQNLCVPFKLLVGNHDNRENFANAFPDTPRDGNGFIQSVHECSAGRLIFLDTLVHGFGHGALDGGRLEWLAARLAEGSQSDSFVFAHHPLQPIGMPHFTPGNVRQWPVIMKLLRDSGTVRHIFCGHVHVDVGGNWQGISFSASRGVAHQIIPHLVRKDAQFVEDAPAFDVALIDDTGVLVHRFEISERPVVAISPDESRSEDAA